MAFNDPLSIGPIIKCKPAATLDTLVGYAELLRDIKTRIKTARVRAAIAVNGELVLLY